MTQVVRKLYKCLLLLPAAFGVLLIRLLRPLVTVRLMPIDIGRIGGMYPPEWYLALKAAGMDQGRNLDIFYCLKTTGQICNRQWLKMWQRAIPILPFWGLAEMVDKVNGRLPGFEEHTIPVHCPFPAYGKEYSELETARAILNHKKVPIAFTPQEEMLGKQALRKLGIPEGKPFICFHARDPLYMKSVMKDRDWSYHDYRDSDIDNYLLAVERMTQKGYYAIRMGAVAEKKIQTRNPLIIDYAANGQRTDSLDVYLGAKCYFFLCSDTGISEIPEVFGRPVIYVNWVPIMRQPSYYVPKGMFIPKKIYSRKEQRLLSFKEIIWSELGSVGDGRVLEAAGVELIENTPEEILKVTMEMEERLQGRWQTSAEDEKLQRDFWEIYGPLQVRSEDFFIGAEFLRQNRELLYSLAKEAGNAA